MNDEQPGSTTELSRDLGYFAVLTTATGTMIGAGIFILPGIAAANAGPGAAVSFLAAGMIAMLAAFSASELSTAMPKAGGSYFFVSRSMGALVATIVGLGAWLSLIFKGSFALVGLGQYVLHFSPVPVLWTAIVGGILLTVINWTGAKVSGTLQNVIVVVLLAILGVFVVRGLFAIDRATLYPLTPQGWSGVAATTGLVFISYLGIVKATAIAEEVRDPGKNIPAGIISSVILVTVLYVLVMIIVTGVLPIAGIDARAAPLADAGEIFLGAVGGAFVAVAGLLATTSTGNAAILSSSRFPFAMSRDGLMSPRLRSISKRFNTPAIAIWVTGSIMVALLFFFDVEALAKLGGTFSIIVFAVLHAAVLMLRHADPEWYEPAFKSPGYPYVQIVGAIAVLALIPQMGRLSQVSAVLFIGVGVAWWAYQRRVGEALKPEFTLKDQLIRIREKRSLEVKRDASEAIPTPDAEEAPRRHIVLELVRAKPNKHLLEIAGSLASEHEAIVDVVIVDEIPDQTPLDSHRDLDPDWVREVKGRIQAYGIETRVHHVLARNRDNAILNLVDEETEMVLIDWHEPFRIHRLKDSHVDVVLRKSPARVGVLKHRGLSDVSTITVATGGGPYDWTEIEVADAIAQGNDATVTLLQVLPPDASGPRKDNARNYLDGLQALMTTPSQQRIVYADDVAEGLIEGSEGTDLLIIGASVQPRFKRTVFGAISDRVSHRADSSVLITKEPSTQPSWIVGLLDRWLGHG